MCEISQPPHDDHYLVFIWLVVKMLNYAQCWNDLCHVAWYSYGIMAKLFIHIFCGHVWELIDLNLCHKQDALALCLQSNCSELIFTTLVVYCDRAVPCSGSDIWCQILSALHYDSKPHYFLWSIVNIWNSTCHQICQCKRFILNWHEAIVNYNDPNHSSHQSRQCFVAEQEIRHYG